MRVRRAVLAVAAELLAVVAGCSSSSTPAAPRANYAFVTSTTYAADAVSPTAADAACAERATAAGLSGHYVAWISTSSVDAKSRLGAARGWVRVDGQPFADSVEGLVAGEVYYPLTVDEYGRTAVGGAVFTGTTAAGVLASANCSDWTKRQDGAVVIVGDRTGGPVAWTESGGTSCGIQGRLYCFGVDVAQPVARPNASGRRAFVTARTVPGGAGLSGFDALCAQEAADAKLAGEYRALVATSGASAASRFDLGGAPWVRPDGVQIVAKAQDLAAPWPLLAPIAIHADGSPSTARLVWTGAATAGATTASADCASWTDGTAGAEGSAGNLGSAEAWFGGWSQLFACDRSMALYCLQR